MFNVKVVGAGQLGSRHLQALKTVRVPLNIQVIDPSNASLQVAKERYDSFPSPQNHRVSFNTSFEAGPVSDLTIVATSSNVRLKALETLFATSGSKRLVLEKLLFDKWADYETARHLLEKKGAQAWVNCTMRVMPVYEKIRATLALHPIHYRVTGSQFGLVTNAIHYLDHVVHLTGCEEFELDTSGLSRELIASRRAGFSEVNGTMTAYFLDGSRCDITCYPSGTAPVVVEIFNYQHRYVVRESEGKMWYSGASSGWNWTEEEAVIPFQSQLTNGVAESILENGTCNLAPFEQSARVHLRLLEPLLGLIRLQAPEATSYPFT